LRLTRLELQGFKSFPDHTVLEFGEGTTAVVGPNGSGKSNIADALRWVLGEQSAHRLRGSTMDDLIFSGSDRRRRLSLAEVRATFDNSDGLLSLPYSEVTITRRVDREGTGEYLINRAQCRLKDIHNLFLDTGLGRGSYAIISQGQVEQVTTFRSEELRLFLEEVAGITRYRMQYAEAGRRLQRAAENVTRLRDLLQELESRLEPLKEQAVRARLHRLLKAESKRLRLRILTTQWMHLVGEAERLGQEEDECRERAADLREQESAAEQQAARLRQATARLEDRIALYRRGLRRLEEDRHAVQREQAVAEERRKAAGESLTRAREGLEEIRAAVSSLSDEMQAAGSEDTGTELIGSLRTLIDEKETALREKTNELARGRQVQERALAREGELTEDLAAAREKVKRREDGLQAALRELAELAGREKRLIHRRDQAAPKAENLRSEDQRLQSRRRAAREELTTAVASVKHWQEEERRISSELDQKRRNSAALGSRARTLREVAASRWGIAEEDRPVDSILGSRLSTDEDLFTPLDAALGYLARAEIVPALEDLISTEGEGKVWPAGTAVLTSIISSPAARERRSRREETRRRWAEWLCEGGPAEAVLGWAYELATIDHPAGQDLLQHALGHVLVVEDMDAAREIAASCWVAEDEALSLNTAGFTPVLVTLAGQVIDLAGVVSGPKGDETGTLAVWHDIHSLEERASEAESDVARLEEDLARVRVELDSARTTRENLREECARLEAQEELLAQQRKTIEDERDRAEEGLTSLRRRREQLRTDIIRSERENAQTVRDTERLSTARHNLRSHLKLWEKRQAQLEDETERLRQELTQLRVEHASRLERHQATGERRKRLEQDLAAQRQRADRLKNEESEVEGILRDSQATLDKLEIASRHYSIAVDRTEKRLAALESEYPTSQRAVQDNEELLSRLRQSLAQWEGRLNQCQIKLARIETEAAAVAETLRREFRVDPRQGLDVPPAAGLDTIKKRVEVLERRIEALEPVNPLSIDEYRRQRERHRSFSRHYHDLTQAQADLAALMEWMDDRMERQFERTVKEVSAAFGRVFASLFDGGRAELARVAGDEGRPGSGVEIRAQPPGKRLSRLSLLSGGESALTGIAFLFALLEIRPAPFCILDEADAALDDVNVERFTSFLRGRGQEIQFILITHQKGTMEAADTLYGVTMPESGVSALVSVRLVEDQVVNG